MSTSCVSRHGLLDRLAGDPVCWNREARVGVLGEIEALRGWLDAREAVVLAECHSERDDVNSGARDLIQLCQQSAGVSYGAAKRRTARAMTLPSLPVAATALADGHLGSAQADELCSLAERLDPALVEVLRDAETRLVAELSQMTPVQARKHLATFEADITPADPEARFEAQKKANRLRFAKNSDGTTALFGQLDPLSAAYLRTCIDNKVNELWRAELPGDQGEEPPAGVMTSQRRRAEALIALVRDGHAAGPGARGHAELLVLIDYHELIGDLAAAGVAHLTDSTPIPASTARRLACEANIMPVVLGGPSQPLDVGRSARTATGAQKTAARAVHDTCCIKNCDVAFEYCQLHHVEWWRHGGQTDLDNLVPMCSKHHHLIHDYNWELRLDTNRVGTLHEPSHLRPTGPSPAPTPGTKPESAPRVQDRQPEAPSSHPVPENGLAPMRC